jgi:hypothetical protein
MAWPQAIGWWTVTSLVPSGKRRFDLDLRDHFRDAFHHLFTAEQGGAVVHQIGHGLAVARAFEQRRGDVGHGFRVIEFHATGQTPLGNQAGGEDQQLVFFAWGQVHGFLGIHQGSLKNVSNPLVTKRRCEVRACSRKRGVRHHNL